METEKPEHQNFDLVDEKRLLATLLSKRPHAGSLQASALVALIIIFTTLLYWRLPVETAQLLPASKEAIFGQSEWWRLFTAVFIHADPAHLLSNLLLLGIFGFFVFGYFGFTVFPLSVVFASGLVNGLTLAYHETGTILLGASGMVYVLGAFWLTLYFFIQRQYRFRNRLIRVTGISLMLFAPTTFVPTTSYAAHGWGFVLGVFIGIIYFLWNKEKIREHEVYETSQDLRNMMTTHLQTASADGLEGSNPER